MLNVLLISELSLFVLLCFYSTHAIRGEASFDPRWSGRINMLSDMHGLTVDRRVYTWQQPVSSPLTSIISIGGGDIEEHRESVMEARRQSPILGGHV